MKSHRKETSYIYKTCDVPHLSCFKINWIYFQAVDWLESHGDEAGFALDAYLSVARYADSQYQNIVNYMKSSTFEAKQNLMKQAKQELEKYSSLADKRE